VTTPLFCIFLVLITVYAPRIAVATAQFQLPGGMDNKHPRDQQAKLSGWSRRANAAHANGFEAFAPFAAAVLVAHVTKADPVWSTNLAVAFVVLRVLYPILYIANIDRLRSAVWIAGFGCIVALFLLPVLG
jgi:uncharacterized MAPEG superfamily protein